MESTASVTTARIWQEYLAGTRSIIEVKCPECGKYVSPGREHLVGWRDAPEEISAGEGARVVCPACGVLWDEEKRLAANADCRLATQNTKRTNVLSVRWHAINNCLVPISDTATMEWLAVTNDDADLEKALKQSRWALPSEPETIELTMADHQKVIDKQVDLPRGTLPPDIQYITVGIDVGMYLCHWTATAWKADGSPHVIDYGVVEVMSKQLGIERALPAGLQGFADTVLATGWGGRKPARVFVDAGDWPDLVNQWAESAGVFPCKGFGERVVRGGRVLDDKGWEAVRLPTGRLLVELLADRWKSRVHDALATPIGRPGALTLFKVARSADHLSYSKHLTAERKLQEFMAGKGWRTRWEQTRSRPNHWLDATALAFAAAETVTIVADPTPSAGAVETDEHEDRGFSASRRW